MSRISLPRSATPVRLLVGACTAALLVSVTAPVSVAASVPATLPTNATVAPYMELSAPNPGNLSAGIDAGLQAVTVAFVVGRGCTPIWDDGVPVAKDKSKAKAVQRAQQAGADVIVSFGGAGGTELARSCTDTGALTDAYQDVIEKLGVTQVDFDVEGKSIDPKSEKASIARRFAAIRRLQQQNPGLGVSVTVPVGPNGLEHSGVKFLEVAQKSDTRVDVVNIMTMDYGGPVADMGGTAIQAAQGTLAQLLKIWSGDSYLNLGITPMIGDNDSAHETFTVDDAAEVWAFATDNGVGRLAFWSLNRDQQCGRQTKARNDCSGVAQDPLEFTKTFLG